MVETHCRLMATILLLVLAVVGAEATPPSPADNVTPAAAASG
jgi:hypothetical protein